MPIHLFHSRIFMAFVMCLCVVAFGTTGYMVIEDYTLVEGLYMSAITISTVGYREVKPLTTFGQGFTTILILFGFVSLAYAGHALGQSLLEKVWSGQAERKRMQKRIQALKGHYILCGFGRVGAAAASYFEDSLVDFVVIEANEGSHALLNEKGYCFLIGDATHEDTLEEAGIKRASGLLALLDDDPDNLFVVLSAREMNPTLHIISRVDENSSSHKIIRAGADNVISPFASTGQRIANDILAATGRIVGTPTIHPESSSTSTCWIVIRDASKLIGTTINEAGKQIGKPILGLRRNGVDALVPNVETVLQDQDELLVIEGENTSISHAVDTESRPTRLVLVDDNPVIIKLYMRLFQKAGFIPHAASNGQTGLEMILKERPQAAVIDYRLPLMSGIEVCKNIRRHLDHNEIKLIIFTVDNRDKTKKMALDAGADAVVVKSPEASEVIQTVSKIIRNGN